jgi:hypothetical protein
MTFKPMIKRYAPPKINGFTLKPPSFIMEYQCNFCSKRFLKKNLFKCEDDQTMSCSECTIVCYSCSKKICEECDYYNCSDCDDILCSLCVDFCFLCEDIYCTDTCVKSHKCVTDDVF